MRVEHHPEARKQAHLYGKDPRLVPHDGGDHSLGDIRKKGRAADEGGEGFTHNLVASHVLRQNSIKKRVIRSSDAQNGEVVALKESNVPIRMAMRRATVSDRKSGVRGGWIRSYRNRFR